MSDLKIFQLPPETVGPLWSVIEPYVSSGAERSSGRLTVQNLRDLLTSGTWQVWTVWEGNECLAALVTSLGVESSGMKSLELLIGSGKGREKWQREVIERLKKFAKDEGCGLFQMWARPGWHRIFPDFEKTHVMLEWKVE